MSLGVLTEGGAELHTQSRMKLLCGLCRVVAVFHFMCLTTFLADAAVSIPGHAHSATATLFYTQCVILDGIPAFCEQKEALMSCVIFYKLHMKKNFLKKWQNVTLTIPYYSSSQAVDLVLCWEGKDLLHLVFVINK